MGHKFMLITSSGFKAFTQYDLSTTLDAQLARLRKDVQSYIESGKTNIFALSEKYKIEPLTFDLKNLTMTMTDLTPKNWTTCN